MRYVNKVMKLIFFTYIIPIMLQLNIVPFKVLALGSHIVLKMVLPLLIALLELGYWNSLQLVSYSCLNVVQGPKVTSLVVNFQSQREKKVTRTQVGQIKRLRSHKDVLTGQKTFY